MVRTKLRWDKIQAGGDALKAILINDRDNVAVALCPIAAGEEIELADGRALQAREAIPVTHKVAVEDIAAGSPVIKYGQAIAIAGQDIGKGQWVHLHNVSNERA